MERYMTTRGENEGSASIMEVICLRRPSGLVGNLHTCLCGSREFDSYQIRICVLSFVTESVGT